MVLYVPDEPQFYDEGNRFVRGPGGIYVPASSVRSLPRIPTAVDFFSGAGGFSVGFIQAGFHVLAGFDMNGPAVLTYRINLGEEPWQVHYATDQDRKKYERAFAHKKPAGSAWLSAWRLEHPEARGVPHFFLGDVRLFDGPMILDTLKVKRGEIDVVVGGPPCQGFSFAGKRQVMDPRNSLVFTFAQRILELWPRFFVMENVPGMLSMVTPDGLPVVDAFCRILADGDYGSYDALKQSLLSMPDVRAGVRAEGRSTSQPQKQRNAGEKPDAGSASPGQRSSAGGKVMVARFDQQDDITQLKLF